MVLSGSFSQLQHELKALVAASCSTLAARTTMGQRLTDPAVAQWQQQHRLGAPQPAPVPLQQLMPLLHDQQQGATSPRGVRAGYMRHAPSGVWLPLSLLLRMVETPLPQACNSSSSPKGAPGSVALARSAACSSGPAATASPVLPVMPHQSGGDVIMSEAQQYIDELRRRPDYSDLMDRAVAMEVDDYRDDTAPITGQQHDCGAISHAAAAVTPPYGGAREGLLLGVSQEMQGEVSGQQQKRRKLPGRRPELSQHRQRGAGPAPHPLSTYPHGEGALPLPRLLLLYDTNILLESRGWVQQ